MRKIVYRSKAIQGIILLAGICLLLSLWPFRFFHEIVTSSVSAESGTMSGKIDNEKTLMQCFVAQYDHMDTIRVYLGEESEGEAFYLRLLDENWQMVCEEKTEIDHSALPGYQEVMVDIDMEVGTMYYCILQGCDSEIFAAVEMTDPSENPYSGLLYYDNSEVAGMGLAADYNYIVPLRKEKVLLFGGIIAVLTAILVLGTGKLLGKKDKLITAEQAFKAVANPLTAAGTLFCLGAVLLGYCSKHLMDNIFFFISVLLLAGILFYGINHDRSDCEPVITSEYLKTHVGDLLQSVFLAGAIGACCEYMSGLFDIHHAVAERKEMIFFALAIIAMFRFKEIVNLYNLVYLTVAGICGFSYYQANLTTEMDEASVQVLKYTVYIAVLTGMILLRSVIALCRKKLSKPNPFYTGLLLLFFAAVIVFRNGRWWTVVMAAGFLLFYLTYGMWEHKERLLTNVCRGIVFQFLWATGYALLHRPYLTFRTARYPHIFHTVTITAAYLTIVECAVLVMLLSKMAGSKKLKTVWKELLLFGVVSSYIMFTMARTAFFAVAVTLVFALIFMTVGRGKEKLGNIGRTFGMMVLAVVICFPVTFTVQRTVPALVSDPYMYEIEDFPEDALRGRKLNSVEFMRVGRFIDVFAEKIFNIPEGTFDPYGEIAAYNREHGIETSDAEAEFGQDREQRKEELVASADYVPEAEQQEDEDDDYTNGRLDIFRSYIEQLNMTGHEEMGALLEDGSIATHAHNIYLQVAYDHGIPVGILFVIVGIVSFVKACLYYVKRKDEIACAALPAVITVSVAVAGLVEWIFHISNPCGFVLMLVITPLLFERGRQEKMKKVKKPFNAAKFYRRTCLVVYDVISVIASSYLALLMRYNFDMAEIPEHFIEPITTFLPFNIVITLFVLYLFRMYNSLWAFAGETELQNLVVSSVISSVLQALGLQFFRVSGQQAVPGSYYFLYMFLLISFIFVSRFSYRFFRSLKHKKQNRNNSISVMVLGAGEAGNVIIKEIVNSNFSTMVIRCIIDDDPGKWGKFIQGIKVAGGRDKIIECADIYGIDEIIVAMPSISREELSKILDICKETSCKLRSLPGMYQLVNGEVSVSKLRDVEVEDLLGRDPIEIDLESILGYVKDQKVLVTGGGGSIGSELCRQIAQHQPAQLIIVDIYENSAYDIQQELVTQYPNLNLVVLIASVRNTNRMNWIFENYKPDIVYHAAAHKHVPLMENSPNEAIKNNVFGTWKTAMAAAMNGTRRFVMISTDKAVNPTNIMGASKRICEMIIQVFNKHYDTEFVAVRFGNVLGSNGSVIPLFKKQILAGGPVKVTHPEIIRYFMTIPEAVSLVLQAGAYAKGGEIFVLDMGKPVKILDLAKNLIRLSGYRVDEDIKIEFTGLRPGEKLYEELLMAEEGMTQTPNKLIHIGKPIEIDEMKFFVQLKELKERSKNEEEDIRPLIKEIVPTYHYHQDQ